jgi:hypothetical protein
MEMATSLAAEQAEQTVKVSNTTGVDIDLWIEPIGDRLPMPKGQTFEIVSTQDLGHEVEIELVEDAIRLHGWVRRISSISATGQRTKLWELPSP